MAEALKHMYNQAFFNKICPVMRTQIPGFNTEKFLRHVFDERWPKLELKERVKHTAQALRLFMPEDFAKAVPILVRVSNALRNEVHAQGFATIFVPEYVMLYGLEHPDESLDALEEITKLVSGEFAIRPFLLRYPQKTFKRMVRWSLHKDAHVRRLASEGCRPRLPWAMGIPVLKKDPSPILQILENLKTDVSEYVRRSVANNLNDIAKDHPELVLGIAKKWQGLGDHTDRIIKHGCRTLLKKGHKKALTLHGFDPNSRSAISALLLSRKKVKIGDVLDFNFSFQNREKRATFFRLEYAIDYITSSGKISRKIFKISERKFSPGDPVSIRRKQSFKNLTTRKHFKGKHLITILANGKALGSHEFFVK